MEPKVVIENGAFKKIPQKVKSLGKAFAIITDNNLKRRGEELLQAMRKAGLKCNLLVLPPGEKTKSIEFVLKITTSLLKLGIKRDGCLIGLGGGVVGDLTAFVASIYLRGIAFVGVPTTLMAMGDSCVGGKTGIDLPEGKNLLGSFYDARMVIVDPTFLQAMPEKVFCAGLSEIVKHGVIADKKFFDFLNKNVIGILRRSPLIMKKIVDQSIKIKLSVVKKDKHESVHNLSCSSRMLLNYGHTVGHAIEKLSDYKVPHGEAIAIGMVAENRIAVAKKLLKESDALRIANLLKRLKLPTKFPDGYSGSDIKKALGMDKKHVGGKLYFALPNGIGKAKVISL